jgi:hypothetical protein
MRRNTFEKLTAFLTDLEQKGISYSLAHNRDEAIMVITSAPGERWEIEFLNDGAVEVERFISDGQMYGQETLNELFARYSEDESSNLELPQEAEVVAAARE